MRREYAYFLSQAEASSPPQSDIGHSALLPRFRHPHRLGQYDHALQYLSLRSLLPVYIGKGRMHYILWRLSHWDTQTWLEEELAQGTRYIEPRWSQRYLRLLEQFCPDPVLYLETRYG